ncbi:MAG: hypothetical protein ACRDZW_11110, partial [Acidimicrobiales bacterium]
MSAPEAEPQFSAREQGVLGKLRRQAGSVAHLRALAEAAGDPVDAALAWQSVQDQSTRDLADLQSLHRARRLEALADHLAAQQALLDGHLADAGARLRAVDGPTADQVQQRRGLRVAVVGKGGAGKSMISATLARLLARQGRPVLAVDLDT